MQFFFSFPIRRCLDHKNAVLFIPFLFLPMWKKKFSRPICKSPAPLICRCHELFLSHAHTPRDLANGHASWTAQGIVRAHGYQEPRQQLFTLYINFLKNKKTKKNIIISQSLKIQSYNQSYLCMNPKTFHKEESVTSNIYIILCHPFFSSSCK